ncbi:hypothetical protein CDEST_06005 [Colletotrichum destructivum]|uniref:Uncharacterized protein n=1 Tax=Colletotrichum destructivum TaxID=34406 RepID=A0AAX4ICA5_9PEZI|nr:hypothetical protein CDEST_06005 [Colletotrichum destructivum]
MRPRSTPKSRCTCLARLRSLVSVHTPETTGIHVPIVPTLSSKQTLNRLELGHATQTRTVTATPIQS